MTIFETLLNSRDFEVYYDTNIGKTYWVLGYFGGGSINIKEAYELAEIFAETYKISLDSIAIDEIMRSSRYKHFKIMYADKNDNLPLEGRETDVRERVYAFLTR